MVIEKMIFHHPQKHQATFLTRSSHTVCLLFHKRRRKHNFGELLCHLSPCGNCFPLARAQKRAVGAFNIANYETARSVILAAEREKSPVIIQLYMRLFNSDKAYDLAGSLIRMAERCP